MGVESRAARFLFNERGGRQDNEKQRMIKELAERAKKLPPKLTHEYLSYLPELVGSGGGNPELALRNARELVEIFEGVVRAGEQIAREAQASGKPAQTAAAEGMAEMREVFSGIRAVEDIKSGVNRSVKPDMRRYERTRESHISKPIRPKGGESMKSMDPVV